MPRPLTSQVKSSIIRKYFSGVTRDDNARKVGRGTGTINRIVDKFEDEVESQGLEKVAEAYNVSTIVRELRELSIELKKENISISDAKTGAKIGSKLLKLEVDPDQIPQFIDQVYRRSTAEGYSVSNIVDDCSKIRNLESKYGGNFEEIKQKFEDMGSRIEDCKKKIGDLTQEIKEKEEHRGDLWDKYECEEKDLEQFKSTSESLAQLGLKIEDLEKIRNVLTEIKKEKYDPRRIIKKFEKTTDLDKDIADKEGRLEQLNQTLEEKEDKLVSLENEVSKKSEVLSEIKQLKETKLSLEAIQSIRNIVIRISANHRISPKDAVEHFLQEISKYYDTLLGLEPEVKSKIRLKEQLESEITDLLKSLEETRNKKNEELERLEDESKTKKSEIKAYNNLRKMGVTDQHLLRWNRIVSESKLNPTVIEIELKSQKNLNKIEAEKNQIIKNLEEKEEKLKKVVETLESKKLSIEESIKNVQKSGIDKIKTASQETSDQLNTALHNMRVTVTEIFQKTEEQLENSKKTSKDTAKRNKKNLEEIENNLNKLSENVNNMIQQALTAGETIQNLKPISETYQFIQKGEGEPRTVIPFTTKYLNNLKNWIHKNKPNSYVEGNIDNILKHLSL